MFEWESDNAKQPSHLGVFIIVIQSMLCHYYYYFFIKHFFSSIMILNFLQPFGHFAWGSCCLATAAIFPLFHSAFAQLNSSWVSGSLPASPHSQFRPFTWIRMVQPTNLYPRHYSDLTAPSLSHPCEYTLYDSGTWAGGLFWSMFFQNRLTGIFRHNYVWFSWFRSMNIQIC